MADVVINTQSESSIQLEVSRFIKAFFGDNFCSPTIDEYGLYIAKSVSMRSVDLSRQVGAAILTSSGDILTVGCNDVPKSGGGQYWGSDSNDFRDFKIKYD